MWLLRASPGSAACCRPGPAGGPVVERGSADLAHACGVGEVAPEQQPLRTKNAHGHVDHPGVEDAAAGVEVDVGRGANRLDRPLPIAAAAHVPADDRGFRISARQLRQLAAVRHVRLGGHEVVAVPGVVKDRHAQRDRLFHDGPDDRVGAFVLVVQLDPDEAVLLDAAAHLVNRLALVAGVDVGVTEHAPGIAPGDLGKETVALAEAIRRGRALARQQRDAHRVDPQALGVGNHLLVRDAPGDRYIIFRA